jgi:hypothetical protein
MFPTPLAGRPIEGVSLFHEYEPAVPLKVTSVVASPLQSVWSPTALIVGVGSTVIVNVCVVPGHVVAP